MNIDFGSNSKNILTAIDIDNSHKNINSIVEKKLELWNATRLREATKVKQNELLAELSEEEKNDKQIKRKIVSDEWKLAKKEELECDSFSTQQREYFYAETLRTHENYSLLRSSLYELNEMNEFSVEIEKYGFQTKENFLKVQELLNLSGQHSILFEKIINNRQQSISDYIKAYHNKKLQINLSPETINLNLHTLYRLQRDIDDVDLYSLFELEDNIGMSNKLADIYFHEAANDNKIDNLINQRNNYGSNYQDLIKSSVISNKQLAIFLLSSFGTERQSFISNNSVTCLKTMWVNNENNSSLYCTRTIGELLLEITNPDYKLVPKENKQQIYMTYNGIRPSKDNYYLWNGLQVFDIDLKKWLQGVPGANIDYLKKCLFDILKDFHWFLWIVKSASGNGLHIYTKVTPPHHIMTKAEENNYISQYWYFINYLQKSSIVYDALFRLHGNPEFNINFSTFIKKTENLEAQEIAGQNIDPIWELELLDNTVARITSGIRLTYDEHPFVNPNFMDLHPALGYSQSLAGWNSHLNHMRTILRKTEINKQLHERIESLWVGNLQEYYDAQGREKEIDLSKFIVAGGDISNITPIPRNQINYITRYNVVNTLAAIYGKDAIDLAHLLLQSEACGNVNEINAFYSTALNNNKEPTKIGLDILKRFNVIKEVKPELAKETDNKFKNHLKRSIESTVNNNKLTYDINLGDKEYLSDYSDYLTTRIVSDQINLIFSPAGSGKCLGKDTPVLMYDGSTKMVQDIVVGDKLMGIDSTPRTVLSLGRGQEELFEITPTKGDKFVVNKSHILSFVESGDWRYKCGETIDSDLIQDLSISQVLRLPEKHYKKLFKVPLNFEKKEIKIPPYWLGLWLGDGHHKRPSIAVGDADINYTVPVIEAYAKKLGCFITKYKDNREGHNVSEYSISSNNSNGYNNQTLNPLTELLREYNLYGNKHIPKEYLLTDRKTRLLLFAGIIDSDGGGSDGTYDIVTKLDSLKDDYVFLCRSLGYMVSVREKYVMGNKYWRIMVSGDFDDLTPYIRIPRKRFPPRKINKNPLVCGFTIKSIGVGDYYGFEIDGDHRFMLGDFTVTHNTEFIKRLAKNDKRILLVLPYISVITNKIIYDEGLKEHFDIYFGAADTKELKYGRNAVMTFDKFSKLNFEKISKMYDYVMVDESHLLFISMYRIETTSAAVRKLKQLYYISANDPFAAKICLFTGTVTGEQFVFDNLNIITVDKKMLEKTMEFIICNDTLSCITAMAWKTSELIRKGYKVLIPTNKGDIYSEKCIGMIEFMLDKSVKYGYYKRSNSEQEICKLINQNNTVGDYEIIFCSNYLSVGVDINDGNTKFASVYWGSYCGYEIEQFNARIRKTGIKSYFCIKTQTDNGEIDFGLLEEPDLVLRATEEEAQNYYDDKQIAGAKQEFIAEYDPVLKRIITPGFSMLYGKIQFDLENYELTMFETKFSECMKHPVKVARELSKYGYSITVDVDFTELSIAQQEELKKIGIESAKNEKIRKHNLLVNTFIELIEQNVYTNDVGLSFENVIDYISENLDSVVEDRDLEQCLKVDFDMFATPSTIVVKSKEALEKMIKDAKFLIKKYSADKCIKMISQYVDESGILKQKNFKRAIQLLKIIDAANGNELSHPVSKTLEAIYNFLDKFEVTPNYHISHQTYKALLDQWTTEYIDYLGIKVNTSYGYDKIKDSIIELLSDVAIRHSTKDGIRYTYNRLPDVDNNQLIKNKSIDKMIERMFKINSELIDNNKINQRIKEKHITLVQQPF